MLSTYDKWRLQTPEEAREHSYRCRCEDCTDRREDAAEARWEARRDD